MQVMGRSSYQTGPQSDEFGLGANDKDVDFATKIKMRSQALLANKKKLTAQGKLLR